MTNEQINSIKILTRSFYDYQDERLSLEARLGIKKDGEARKGTPPRDDAMLALLMDRYDNLCNTEESLKKELAKVVHQTDLWKSFLVNVKGCGEGMAAVLISEYDIHKATTVSKMWAFAGLAPGMGKGRKYDKKKEMPYYTDEMVRKDKRTVGFLCPFNQFLRAKLCGVLGSGFLKCNSPYREYYDNMKHRLESDGWGTASKNPTDKKRPNAGHQHKAANRYMVKMFLKDLYVAWRSIEGLPVRAPYQEEYLNKRHSA